MRRLTIAALTAAASILAMAAPVMAQDAELDPEAGDEATPADTAAPVGRADENAITAAQDAFGTSVGRETIGLYTSFNIRGFSPISAGNARIEGLYFDQTWGLNSRIRQSTTIRVGISALGTPFPAPTGIVDYAFRKPGDEPSLSVAAGTDSYGSAFIEADAVIPIIADRLSVGIGSAGFIESYYNGTHGRYHNSAVSLRWTPSPAVEIIPYWQRSEGYDDEAGPIFIPATSVLPPSVPRRRFLGPDWATYRGAAFNYGLLSRFDLGSGWTLRGGVFRSGFDDSQSFSHLLVDLTPDGRATRLIIADPPVYIASTSGEVRLTREVREGPRLHLVHFSARARDRFRRYDGSQVIEYGPTTTDAPFDVPEPTFAFGEQTRDRVRQWTGGIGYEGRWTGVGEINLGVQRSDYTKRLTRPGLPLANVQNQPWLYNINGAVFVTPRLALYGGYARGLEESGAAPDNASNRNELLPAIITTQRDAGLRYAFSDNLRLIAGVFDIRKPYFSLNAANRFELLGDIRNQGIELSLSGSLTSRLNIVAGAVLTRPRVTGEGVTLGRIGRRPVGLPSRRIEVSGDWRVPGVEGLSLDATISHSSKIPATVDNLAAIPERTLVDTSVRYRFNLSGNPATLRVGASNLFDVRGYELQGAGAYDLFAGRVVSLFLGIDF